MIQLQPAMSIDRSSLEKKISVRAKCKLHYIVSNSITSTLVSCICLIWIMLHPFLLGVSGHDCDAVTSWEIVVQLAGNSTVSEQDKRW